MILVHAHGVSLPTCRLMPRHFLAVYPLEVPGMTNCLPDGLL